MIAPERSIWRSIKAFYQAARVAAARKMTDPGGRVIAYVMTLSGPEPADERQSALDHEHYVQKQVRPVAEPVLALLQLTFDKVIGDNRQLELFG